MTSKKILTLFAYVLALTLLITPHGQATETKNTEYNDQEITEILKSLGLKTTKTVSFILLSELIGDIIHEFGHYCALKAIDPSIQNSIHLRASSKTVREICSPIKPNPLFTVGKTSFYGDGAININKIPNRKDIDNLDPSKKIAFFAAGGASKLIFTYFLLTILAAHKKHQESETLKESLLFGIQHALTPFENISSTKKLTPVQLIFETILATLLMFFCLDDLFYTFTPVSLTSFSNLGGALPDGVHAWYALLGYNERRPLNGDQIFTFKSIQILFGVLYVIALAVLAKKSISTVLHYYKEDEYGEQNSPELGEIETAIREALQSASKKDPDLDIKNELSEKQPVTPATI